MPRYGEAAVVSKAWQDDRPILSAVVPAAAIGVGGLKLKSAVRPNSAGQVKRAESQLQRHADSMKEAFNAQQKAKVAPPVQPAGKLHPLKFVGRKAASVGNQKRNIYRADQKFKYSEMSFKNAEKNLHRVKAVKAPASAIPRVRAGRAAIGGALLTGGTIGAWRRLGPRPQPQGGSYGPVG